MTRASGRSREGIGSMARRAILSLLALPLALLLGECGLRQPALVIDDSANVLDRSRVAAAAKPLQDHGVKVAVIAVDRGDNRGADFTRRLARGGLGGRKGIAWNAVAVYISYEPRYSELRAGTQWSPVLPKQVLATIRQDTLNPALRDSDTTAGVAAALGAVN